MTGRLRLPVDYVTVNCDNLETKRLLAAETKMVASGLAQLSSKVDDVTSLLQEVLSRLPPKPDPQ